MGFGQYVGHVGNVEMPDIRAEERLEAGAERIDGRIERPRVDRVVRLASEIEIAREQVSDIFGGFDAASRVVVERRWISGPGVYEFATRGIGFRFAESGG